jgi:ABC-type dipeptide/oligopeptide/nickel transport system ATPase subunit
MTPDVLMIVSLMEGHRDITIIMILTNKKITRRMSERNKMMIKKENFLSSSMMRRVLKNMHACKMYDDEPIIER